MESSKVFFDCSWWKILSKQMAVLFSFLLQTLLQANICLAHCFFVSVFCSYVLFYVADVNTAWCVELYGQPIVTHLIAVWICSLCWSTSGNRLWTTHATFSGAPDWICFWYVWYMFISMLIHDHVMRCLEIEKEFFPVGAGLSFTMNQIAKHFNAVQFFGLVLKLQSLIAILCIIPHIIIKMEMSWLNQHFRWRCCFKSTFKNNI